MPVLVGILWSAILIIVELILAMSVLAFILGIV